MGSFSFHNILGISSAVGQLLLSEEDLTSMQSVTYKIITKHDMATK
jgi:hypothetical protein